jgi:flavin-binding protein dodecin
MEHIMKRGKTARPSGQNRLQPTMTGRDGAVDFALKMENVDRGELGPDHIYRVIELVGTSEKGIEEAIQSAVTRANKRLRNLRWFEVVRTSGHIEDGNVRHFQVTLKVGFTMEDTA